MNDALGSRVYLPWAGVETDILHLNMMGSHLVFLSDSDVAADLVGRRSAMYVDRVCKRSDTLTIFTLTGAHPLKFRATMLVELYEFSISSITTPANDLLQNGVLSTLLHDALRENLACPPRAVSPLFQRLGGRSI